MHALFLMRNTTDTSTMWRAESARTFILGDAGGMETTGKMWQTAWRGAGRRLPYLTARMMGIITLSIYGRQCIGNFVAHGPHIFHDALIM